MRSAPLQHISCKHPSLFAILSRTGATTTGLEVPMLPLLRPLSCLRRHPLRGDWRSAPVSITIRTSVLWHGHA